MKYMFAALIFIAISCKNKYCQSPELEVFDSIQYQYGYVIIGYHFRDSIQFSDSIVSRVFKGSRAQYEFEKTPIQPLPCPHCFSVQTIFPTGFGRESPDYINLK